MFTGNVNIGCEVFCSFNTKKIIKGGDQGGMQRAGLAHQKKQDLHLVSCMGLGVGCKNTLVNVVKRSLFS